MKERSIRTLGRWLIALIPLVPTGCSQSPRINNPGVMRDANYLVNVAGDGIYARAFDKDGLQSVRATTPDGKMHTLYEKTSDEIDYKLFTQLSPEGKIQRGLYNLTVTDIFGGIETVTTNSKDIEKAPHPHWASP